MTRTQRGRKPTRAATAIGVILAAILAALLLASCANPSANKVPVEAVTLDVTAQTLSIGGTLKLNATIAPVDASDKGLTWITGNAAVATVTSDGFVTAKAGGATTVTVHTADGDQTATCDISVIPAYAVTFDTADGTAISAQSVESGTIATKPAIDPTRTGYVFDGWYADTARTNSWDFASNSITQPTTIYAKWTGIDYTIAYNVNGGSGTMSSITRACGTDVTLPSCNFEPPLGYVFAGWGLTPTANSSSRFNAGAIFTMIPGGSTLYAIWDYAFTFTGSGSLTITGLSSNWPASETTLAIPSTIDGKAVTAIGMIAFSGKQNLVALFIPDSVQTIGTNAFANCSGLVSVSLGAGLTRINTNAFMDCSSLTSISIPASVTSMPAGSAFMGCSKLQAITVAAANPNYTSENGVVYNKDKTFLMRCPQKMSGTFVIPNTVTSVYEYAFEGCTGITSFTWSTSLSIIGNSSFIGCTGLTFLSFPASLTSINYNAFRGCSNLASVTLNDGLIQVRQYAFSSTALTTLALPASVTDFQNQGITGLTAITVDVANTAYTSVDGVLYSKDQKTLHTYPAAKSGTTYTVLSTVTTIGMDAFTNSNLQSITLPSGLTTIANNAIMQCVNLESITIPSTVTAIGMNLVWGCTKLTTLTVDAAIPPTLGSSLPSISGLQIKVPAASVDAYKAATSWSQSASQIIAQ